MMNEYGKSDSFIVPERLPNKACKKAAEAMEERELAKGNTFRQNAYRTQCRAHAQSALRRVRTAAKGDRKLRFTALFHHVYSVGMLCTAYYGIKRDAAAGIDGETWQEYGRNLETNVKELSQRLKRGAYRAKPTVRHYIDKPDGSRRPIGISILEDKIVQRAATEVMNAVYEQDFLGFSYGFRQGRSPHHALDALYVGIMRKKVNWVLDADVRAFFDTLQHEWLVTFIEHRIADRRIIRLIQKWLRAGVLEDDKLTRNSEGTVQGGSISPLLANIYLHYVFDLWAEQWRRRSHGDVITVRFADDFVVGFQYRHKAEQFLFELQERFSNFGLRVHSDKTRLVEFGRFAAQDREKRGTGKPETFNFLGFTHICGKTIKGKFTILRKTIRKKLQRKLKEVYIKLRRIMHYPVPVQGRYLRSVVSGHVRYYGVPMNSSALSVFRKEICRMWYKVLRRRSHKSRVIWERMKRLIERWIPKAYICHPYPTLRLSVIT
jgi:RNA-directed DNA polymerase